MDGGSQATSSPTGARIAATDGISFFRMLMTRVLMFQMPKS
jgi:hypothetical protein